MYKVTEGLSPPFMREIFPLNKNSSSGNVTGNTRAKPQFYNTANPRKVNTGVETLRNLGPKIWELVPKNLKNASSLPIFKDNIGKFKFNNCPCRLCKEFIPNLGFI